MSKPFKAGINCDNYKLDRFKKKLAKAGFDDIKVTDFTADTSLITVNTTKDRVNEIRKICTLVEIHFKRGN